MYIYIYVCANTYYVYIYNIHLHPFIFNRGILSLQPLRAFDGCAIPLRPCDPVELRPLEPSAFHNYPFWVDGHPPDGGFNTPWKSAEVHVGKRKPLFNKEFPATGFCNGTANSEQHIQQCIEIRRRCNIKKHKHRLPTVNWSFSAGSLKPFPEDFAEDVGTNCWMEGVQMTHKYDIISILNWQVWNLSNFQVIPTISATFEIWQCEGCQLSQLKSHLPMDLLPGDCRIFERFPC